VYTVARNVCGLFLAGICTTLALSAANTKTIHGVVTDRAGEPIRGAMITATAGTNLVARFSQNDGRYQITPPAENCEIVAEAYGFASMRVTRAATQAGDLNFSLTPEFSAAQLTSAEVEELLPDNQETRLLKNECIRCHALTYLARRAGMTASEWASFIPEMTRGRHSNDPNFRGDRLAALSTALEKYFGPNSPYFGPDAKLSKDQIKHSKPTEAVLRATIREYRIPTRDPFPHSITTDAQGNAWFSEVSDRGNKVGKFNYKTEEFTEYPMPWPSSLPHTGAVDRHGIFWVTLIGGTIPAKLAAIDTETGKLMTYDFPGSKARTHTLALDQEGNVWMSGTTLLEFDVKTKQFREFKLPVPTDTDYSDNTWAGWHNLPGKPKTPPNQNVYDVRVDSRGMIWASIESLGLLVRLDPKTGETKTFNPPESPSIKGLEIDKDDNVWFAVFWGSRLGKLDQKTGKFTIYKLPTEFGMPYGMSADNKTGDIWYADMNGNYITRFDPKAETFDQYPIPSAQASPRMIRYDNGRVWFGEFMNDKIGVVEPNGDRVEQVSK
jgi:virginiamycin B lyase